MIIKQISVFIENKTGRIYEAASILENNNINIRSLSLADSTDYGVLRMIVDKPEEAYQVLKEAGLTAKVSEVVAVEVKDQVGGFAEIMKIMYEAKINVEYMYAFVEKNKDNAILIFRFDKIKETVDVLRENGLHILKAKEVMSL